jgi:hypothetical protein
MWPQATPYEFSATRAEKIDALQTHVVQVSGLRHWGGDANLRRD